jgi:hypothetical protein
MLEKEQIADALRDIGAQIVRVQTPVIAVAPVPPKDKKQGGP